MISKEPVMSSDTKAVINDEVETTEKTDIKVIMDPSKKFLLRSLMLRKNNLFKRTSRLLQGVMDPSKLSRHNRRAFIRVNNKFVDLDNQYKALLRK